MSEQKNKKYQITDIAHNDYPFLHRIRALHAFGDVAAGDIGGFVEGEYNLSFDPGDSAWIYDDAIAAGCAVIERDSKLRNQAIACDEARVSMGSVLLDSARAEDQAYVRGAVLRDHARASGDAMLLDSVATQSGPILEGNCAVYGKVSGGVRISGSVLVLHAEEVINASRDLLVINDQGRSILRSPSRDIFSQNERTETQKRNRTKPKSRGQDR